MILRILAAILVAVLGIGTCALAEVASPVTLTDGNSLVSIGPYSESGIYDWTVELSNHMAQSSYWYRIGGAGIAAPVSSLTFDYAEVSATEATLYYTGDSFDMSILYSLYGGEVGSGASDLYQSVMITNKTGSAMTFHLFEYVNFDLNGNPAGETATQTSSSSVSQSEGTSVGELNAVSIPSHWEIGDAAALLAKLNNDSFENLSDAVSPYTGDAALILQWDKYIAAYGTAAPIGQDMLISGAPVPEPSSIMALMGALGLIPALRRRRR